MHFIPNLTPYHPSKRIPIFGRVAAGLPLLAEENIEGYTSIDFDDDEVFYALRVHGDSMNAVGIDDGDLVVVCQQSAVDDGQIAVVLVNGDDTTIKYIKTSLPITAEQWTLRCWKSRRRWPGSSKCSKKTM